jgi:hypothetical protein
MDGFHNLEVLGISMGHPLLQVMPYNLTHVSTEARSL